MPVCFALFPFWSHVKNNLNGTEPACVLLLEGVCAKPQPAFSQGLVLFLLDSSKILLTQRNSALICEDWEPTCISGGFSVPLYLNLSMVPKKCEI